jgi:hypothetical protein
MVVPDFLGHGVQRVDLLEIESDPGQTPRRASRAFPDVLCAWDS